MNEKILSTHATITQESSVPYFEQHRHRDTLILSTDKILPDPLFTEKETTIQALYWQYHSSFICEEFSLRITNPFVPQDAHETVRFSPGGPVTVTVVPQLGQVNCFVICT